MEIKHITQPTNNSCMTTCAAMILGKDVEWILDNHEEVYNGTVWLDDLLRHENIRFYYGHPREAVISGHCLALITVASLNHEGGLHQVLVMRTDYKGEVTFQVFDPMRGYGNNYRYYVAPGEVESNNEVELRSWMVDLIIPLIIKE